jgi:hypothetical protein
MAVSTNTRYAGAEAWMFPDPLRGETVRTIAVNRLHDGAYCVVDGVYSTELDNPANTRTAHASTGYRSIPADRLLDAVKAGTISSHGRAPFGRQGVQPALAIDLTPEHAREFGCELSLYTDQEGNDHVGFLIISAWAYLQLTAARSFSIGSLAELPQSTLTYAPLADWLPRLRAEDPACSFKPFADAKFSVFGMPRIASTVRDERNAARIAGSIYERANATAIPVESAPAGDPAPLRSRAASGWRRS